jgi:hypothetical protein
MGWEVRLGPVRAQLHRAADLACGGGRDGDMRPGPQGVAEGAADERREDAHVLLRYAEHGRDFVPRADHVLPSFCRTVRPRPTDVAVTSRRTWHIPCRVENRGD